MNRFIKFSINMTLVVASCAAIVACGSGSDSGSELEVASSEAALAATETSEKAVSASCPCTIWPTTALPRLASDADKASVNLGVKFTADVGGYVTGIKFYKGAGNSGTHVGSLWSASGQLLARANFTGETATGWQSVTFSKPVAISAGANYTASYLAPAGRYAVDQSYFTKAFATPPLRATAGVYKYDSLSAFPSAQWNSSNYWVDVMFTATTAPPPAPPPAPDRSANLSWVASGTPSIVGYRVYYGTSSRKYLQAKGAGISAGTSNSFTITKLSPGNKYFFSVTSVDAMGNESSYSAEASKLIQ